MAEMTEDEIETLAWELEPKMMAIRKDPRAALADGLAKIRATMLAEYEADMAQRQANLDADMARRVAALDAEFAAQLRTKLAAADTRLRDKVEAAEAQLRAKMQAAEAQIEAQFAALIADLRAAAGRALAPTQCRRARPGVAVILRCACSHGVEPVGIEPGSRPPPAPFPTGI
jgi:hypothetical protein